MNAIHEYLTSEYTTSGKTMYTLHELTNKFGKDSRKQLNDLFKSGIVKKQNGVNGDLVKFVKVIL